jgi:mitofusin
MAAYINHAVSLMSGDDPGIRGPSLDVGPMADARSLHDSSPLQIFVKTKKKINDIFVEIVDYVRDTAIYMQSKYQICFK